MNEKQKEKIYEGIIAILNTRKLTTDDPIGLYFIRTMIDESRAGYFISWIEATLQGNYQEIGWSNTCYILNILCKNKLVNEEQAQKFLTSFLFYLQLENEHSLPITNQKFLPILTMMQIMQKDWDPIVIDKMIISLVMEKLCTEMNLTRIHATLINIYACLALLKPEQQNNLLSLLQEIKSSIDIENTQRGSMEEQIFLTATTIEERISEEMSLSVPMLN